tara:strand:+ start:204 stop:671 length:468 start_codon:yes stop_codon:yes gene_type:complete
MFYLGELDMGTRSITVIEDEEGKELCRIYRQFDGYPSHHGDELGNIVNRGPVVSRKVLGSSDYLGMPELAATVVATLKSYIRDPVTGNYEWNNPMFDNNRIQLMPKGKHDAGEEWIYTITYAGDGEFANVYAYDVYEGQRYILHEDLDEFHWLEA